MENKIQRSIRTAVVTGPTGAIGVALCEKLLQENVTIYAVCRRGSSRIKELPASPALHIVECDVSNLAALPQKMKGVQADAFFHFAWAHTIGQGRNDMSAQILNIQGTLDAVHAAKALGCQVFLGAGSQAEYGRADGVLKSDTPTFPENGYGMAKLCAGQMSRLEAQRLGLEHIWIRILSVYGPHDGPLTMVSSTIRKLLAGEKPLLTAGIQKWDYLYSADAANAFFLAAQHGKNGALYPLGSGQALPLKDYIFQLRDAIDPKLPIGLGEVPYSAFQVMHLQADISALKNDTGFQPQVSFADGIRYTINWIKRTGHRIKNET